jgi:hypothetical protein
MPSFDEVLERFWDTGDTDGVHPPLTREAISDTERKLGVRLPPDYLKLMRVRNGGRVSRELDGAPLDPPREYRSGHVSEYVAFDDLYGLGGGGRDSHLWRSEDFPEEAELPAGLVFIGSPDGHEYLALDYRECGADGEPSVVWVDSELGFIEHLAPTFRAFLERLRPAESFPSAIAARERIDAMPRRRSAAARLLGRLRGR